MEKYEFIDCLKHAEHKIFCNCIHVYNLYEGHDFHKIYKALSRKKNLKIRKILIVKNKNRCEYPTLYICYFGTAKGIYIK